MRELNKNIENKRKVANVLAQRKCRGFDTPIKITLDRSGNEGEWVLETINNLVSHYPASPIEILDEALVNLSYSIKHPSETITISRNEAWKLYSYDFISVSYILRQFEELQYIKSFGTISSKDITIESKGWEKLSELRRSLSKDKKQAFVAIWFDQKMDQFFNHGIKPAFEHDGTKCSRIDLTEHNNKICDEIIAEIRRSS